MAGASREAYRTAEPLRRGASRGVGVAAAGAASAALADIGRSADAGGRLSREVTAADPDLCN